MRIPYYIHKILKNITKYTSDKNKIMLGRWNLKHDTKKLHIFYTQIPDPGYTYIKK